VDRKKMLQVLIPAVGAAAVVLLVAVLISMGDATPPPTGKAPATQQNANAAPVAGDDAGMSDTMPPLDAPEWKPGPDGMNVWDVKEGEGYTCPANATVTIHYTGWTTDGLVFDSSRKSLAPRPTSGAPATFPLTTLIKGWQEGIPGMKRGGIRRLYIPYQLAYGEQGRPPTIPPKADLIFEVKLIDWKK
jgi:FKBP-type peptidyl-prolyl cis-trans isomerase